MGYARLEFAIVGLGKMGGNLARQALEKGAHVVGYNIGPIDPDLMVKGLVAADDYSSLKTNLNSPRMVLLYVPAGDVVDQVIGKLEAVLEPGDIILDGGNSYWRDSIRRHARLRERGIGFVDLGTSGGPGGALHGACFMAGGDEGVVRTVEPLLVSLATPGGFVHAGAPGSGHFVKLVHNGIEFGMMQALGEGLDLLERHEGELNIEPVLEAWRHGSVIRSWLLDLLASSYKDLDGFINVGGYVEDTGEVNWLVQDAARMEVPIPVIAQSVWQLMLSRDNEKNWAKAIAAMRHGFGGHPFGPDAQIARIRRTSRSEDELSR